MPKNRASYLVMIEKYEEAVEWLVDEDFVVRKDWWADAECRDMDTNLFFPPSADHPFRPASKANVKRIGVCIDTCDKCPVRRECLHDEFRSMSVRSGKIYGIRAGMNEATRMHVAKALRIKSYRGEYSE